MTKFTDRELKVLEMVSHGMNLDEIAKELEITASGVDKFIQNMFTKTGTVNRAHLVAWAYRNGVL